MSIFYPFTALVGQDELKLSLILTAVNPGIGGVLIRGEKGTAKSTAVRGLTGLLPEMAVVSGCRFACDPEDKKGLCGACEANGNRLPAELRPARLVNLPLNAAEDRVAGGIDFSATIKRGRTVFQPGLLADAHRGVLYIDEVNLLDDHIVDLILDTAVSGWNVVEREGISFTHPSRFVLIGTMNPEEGELRPQLLDRFGLCIEVQGSADPEERVSLLRRREAFDADPKRFCARFQQKEQQIQKQIREARNRIALVRMSPQMRGFTSELCQENHVAGHRADLVMEQAALSLAALEGKEVVESEHIRRIAAMALIHRCRDAEPPPVPPPPQESGENQEDNRDGEQEDQKNKPEQKESPGKEQQPQNGEAQQQEETEKVEDRESAEPEYSPDRGPQESTEQLFDIGPVFQVKKISTQKDRQIRRGPGRRSRSRVSQKQGRYSRAASHGVPGDIALDATIRAAAPHQANRNGPLAVQLTAADFRYKIREKRIGNLLLFIVDASGSMGARGRMAASKGAVMSLLLDAYQKRDKVALISFRRDQATLNLPVTGSVELAGKLLAEMTVGGRTPLSAGLVKGYEQVRNYLIREPAGRPIIVILTDGKTNVSTGEQKPVEEMVQLAGGMAAEQRAKYIVVDTEEAGLVTFNLAAKLAAALEAEYFKIHDIQAENLVQLVREQQ